jgi:pimeloyl-ACP methyl ester carboxylesterase
MSQLSRSLVVKLLGVPVAAAAGWIGYSHLIVPHRLPLPPAVPGERREWESRAGKLSYYVDGPESAPPLLLIHSINAAGSAYEVRPLYQYYRATRRVYALDLPGFGFSDRSPRDYTPRLMTDAIHVMVDELRRIHGEVSIDVLAVSLASEFLARAAAERPNDYRTIAIVSPTGFSAVAPQPGPAGENCGRPWLHGALTLPLWNRPIFDALTSRPSIRFFLRKTWGSDDIDEGLAEYDYLTTHQPGAQNAPYYFVAGFLFSADIRRIYDCLLQPVFMTHGVRGDFQDYSRKRDLQSKDSWTIRVFETGALPYFETPDEFVQEYDLFLARP